MRLWVCGLCLLMACAGSQRVIISRPSAASDPPAPTPLPPARGADSGRAGELVRHRLVGPLQSLFNSPGVARRLAVRRAEAYNVPSADAAADHAWWVWPGPARMTSQDASGAPVTSAQ